METAKSKSDIMNIFLMFFSVCYTEPVEMLGNNLLCFDKLSVTHPNSNSIFNTYKVFETLQDM